MFGRTEQIISIRAKLKPTVFKHGRIRSRGSAIAETGAFLLLFMPILSFVVVIFLVLFDLGLHVYHQVRIAHAAEAGARAARYGLESIEWLGMVIVDRESAFNLNNVVTDAVNGDLKVMGLPSADAIAVKNDHLLKAVLKLPAQTAPRDYCRSWRYVSVAVTINNLPSLKMASRFIPGFDTITERATCTLGSETPQGYVGITMGGGASPYPLTSIMLPSYGHGLPQSGEAGPHGNFNSLPGQYWGWWGGSQAITPEGGWNYEY